jgi:malectin (di-glucose binding ER protein)
LRCSRVILVGASLSAGCFAETRAPAPHGEDAAPASASASRDAGAGIDARLPAGPCPDVEGLVLKTSCAAGGCHSAADNQSGLDLESPNLLRRILGQPAQGGPGLLIDPGDPPASVLYTKLTSNPPFGVRMPYEQPPLDEDTTLCVLRWIAGSDDAGAPSIGDASWRDAGVEDASRPTGSIVRIACGRTSDYIDYNGEVWAADTGFVGGDTATHTPTISIAGTMDGLLYNSQRYGDDMGRAVSFRYAVAVIPGTYEVTLKFAETYDTRAGARLFDVSIDGTAVLTQFDIFQAAGGPDIAEDRTFAVDAASGMISIQFDPAGADFPKIDAIEIVPR